MNKQALDQGFIDQCVRYNITDPSQIGELMKYANQAIVQQQLVQKRAQMGMDTLSQLGVTPEQLQAMGIDPNLPIDQIIQLLQQQGLI